jgi:hypothetical protein
MDHKRETRPHKSKSLGEPDQTDHPSVLRQQVPGVLHIVARGIPINANYIVKVLGLFMKQLKKKRPAMVAQQWWFYSDNAPVHTAAVVQEWLAAHSV